MIVNDLPIERRLTRRLAGEIARSRSRGQRVSAFYANAVSAGVERRMADKSEAT